MKLSSGLFTFATAALSVSAAPSSSPLLNDSNDTPKTSISSISTTTAESPCSTSTWSNERPSGTGPSGPIDESGVPSDEEDDGNVVGAVYFTTNHPDGNSVVIATIGNDGNLTYGGTVSAGGKGEHVNDGGRMGADATFSNSLVAVHTELGLLATANTASNTIVLFQIDPTNPRNLTLLGPGPVPSMGDYPSSLTFSSAGDVLCVMNAGARATVACFSVDPAAGLAPIASSLRAIPGGYNQTTPPTGPANTASAIAFTEDERALVVAVKGSGAPGAEAPGYLAAWPIEAGTGGGFLAADPTLIATPTPDGISDPEDGGLPLGGALAFSLTPIPGRNAFLAADFLSAVDVFDFGSLNASESSAGLADVSAPSSSATRAVKVGGGLSLCWSAYSKVLDRYYLAAPPSGLVVEVALDDELQPMLIGNHTVVPGGLNIDLAIATANKQDYIYTILTNEMSLAAIRLDGPGKSTLVGTTNFNQSVTDDGAAIRPNYSQGIAVYIAPGSASNNNSST